MRGFSGLREGLCTDNGANAEIDTIEFFGRSVLHFRNLHMMKVLIIGGGWAGIAAAMQATRNGWQVELVEERPYLGGRARSFVDRTTGDEIDNGQHVMMGCYSELLRVLDDLGTASLLERQAALRVAFVDTLRRRDVLDAGLLPGRLGMVFGLMRLKGLRLASRLAIIRLAVSVMLHRSIGRGQTCADLLMNSGQPSEAITRFWEPLILATLNAPIDLASAEMLAAVLRLAFFGSTTDAQLLIPTVGLSRLIDPLPEWLAARGGRVRTSVSIDRLVVDNGTVVEAWASDGTQMDVDAVVCAMPYRALARLAANSDLHLPDTMEASMSPIVSVYLWYDRTWMDLDLISALGTTVQWVFNKRRIAPGLVALTVSAADDVVAKSSEEIIGACDRELRTLFGDALDGVLLRNGIVIKEKSATPCITPEVHARRWGADAIGRVVANVGIAGDWTQTGLPATLEGAARSGVAAIASVAQALPGGQRVRR